eukprot:364737-Chlamydomonas_euryale.AAC.10
MESPHQLSCLQAKDPRETDRRVASRARGAYRGGGAAPRSTGRGATRRTCRGAAADLGAPVRCPQRRPLEPPCARDDDALSTYVEAATSLWA